MSKWVHLATLTPANALPALLADPFAEYDDEKAIIIEVTAFLGILSKLQQKDIEPILGVLNESQSATLFDYLNRSMQQVAQKGGNGNAALKVFNKLIAAKGKAIIHRATSRRGMVRQTTNFVLK